jgi:hypothetical protein
VTQVTAQLAAEKVAMVQEAAADLKEAGTIEQLVLETIGDECEPEVSVVLAQDG